MIYIGIDPGANGGIGLIDTIDERAKAYPYSNDTLMELLCQPGRIKVMVEGLAPMPNEKRASIAAFKLGESYGVIQGILIATRTEYETASPRKWKKEFSLTGDKKKTIECCKRLFPGVDLKKNERCRTDHDGMAEALLIAEYGRRHMK